MAEKVRKSLTTYTKETQGKSNRSHQRQAEVQQNPGSDYPVKAEEEANEPRYDSEG
jgi:hypothetical protein